MITYLLSPAIFFSVFLFLGKKLSIFPTINQPKRFLYYFLFFIFAAINIIFFTIFAHFKISHLAPVTSVVLFLICYSALIRHKALQKINLINAIEKIITLKLLLISCTTLVITIVATLIIYKDTVRFFQYVPPHKFIFGTYWNPAEYELDPHNTFGVLPVLFGTLFIAFISMAFGVPMGFFTAIYLSYYCSKKTKNTLKAIFETLVGIPTVVYGFCAAFFIAPFVTRFMRETFGIQISLENFLVPGITIGIMILPYIATLLDDTFSSVPKSLIESSHAVGLSRSETIKHICLPYSIEGIVDALIIVFSRTIGETIIVSISCGVFASVSLNPLSPGTTITTQIVHLLGGDNSLDTPKALAAFALSGVLLLLSTVINLGALHVKKRLSKTKVL